MAARRVQLTRAMSWSQLRERYAVRVGVAYAVAAWLLIQVSTSVLPALDVPPWTVQLVIVLTALGIVPAVALAWAFDRAGARAQPQPADVAVAAAVTDTHSIAVLPFANLSGSTEDEYFSDGMTEEVIDRLVKARALRVAARTSCFAFKGRNEDISDIARQLRVAYVLEGSVRRSAERLRVTAQLIDAATGFHVWSHTYERVLADVFALQDEIGAAIITALHTSLGTESNAGAASTTSDTRPASVHAYDLYLQGRYLLNRRSSAAIRNAMERLQLALACDPHYAPAHAALAECYLILASGTYAVMAPAHALARATASAEKALALQPSLAHAHAALGLARMYSWDWSASEALLAGAVELEPDNAHMHHQYGWRLALTNNLVRALAAMDRALDLDPLSLTIRVARARILQFMRRPDDAIAELERALKVDADFAAAHMSLGLALVQSGRAGDAIAALRRAREISDTPAVTALLAYALGAAGDQDAAARIVTELMQRATQQYTSPVTIAGALIGLGRVDEALEWYERAYAERSPGMVYLLVEPLLDPLRGDARFRSLLQRVGLADAARDAAAAGALSS